MSLQPGETIPLETHHGLSQFFRIESGRGVLVHNNKTFRLGDGVSVIVPAETTHEIRNTHPTKSLKLYTIYSPPHHPPGKKQKRL